MSADETGWPVLPAFSDHPLGATLGEFRDNQANPPAGYQHTGIDILVVPWHAGTDDSSAAWVTVTVGGVVDEFEDDQDEASNPEKMWIQTVIETPDGRRYRYMHLADESFDPEFANIGRSKGEVVAGVPIARVVPWKEGSCAGSYNHLHYDIQVGDNYLNPLLEIGTEADPDDLAPDIFNVGFAKKRRNGSWSQFNSTGQSCIKVNGKVEIVAHVRDRDNAGATGAAALNLGAYNLRWRACPVAAPECDNWSTPHSYGQMPVALEDQIDNHVTKSRFSMLHPWKSDFDACSIAPDQTYVIITGPPSKAWDTASGDFPNGEYMVTVEARDVKGLVGVHEKRACVRN